MKKLIAILLGVVLMASMLAVFTVPASADYYTPEIINGEPYFEVDSTGDLVYFFNSVKSYGDKVVHIILNFVDEYTVMTIEVRTRNYYRFELYKGADGPIQNCIMRNIFPNNNNPLFYIAESAAGTVLDFPSTVTLTGRNESGDGGVIYVDAENCTISGAHFADGYAKEDGGAICVNRDNCTISNCRFSNCRADDDGGAIYFCSGADNGAVWNCTFSGCSSDDEGNFVNGDGDTVINLCTYGDDDDDYYHCNIQSFAGSVLSDGSLWIIVAVAVVVIAALVVLVVLKKKKKVIATAGNASDSDDE